MYFEVVGTNIRILGSMHAFPVGAVGIPQFVKSAYEWSDALILEHDGLKLLPHFKMGESDTAPHVFDPDTIMAIRSFWPDHELFNPLDRIHPWALFILISGFSLEFVPGVEAYVSEMAVRDNKSITNLETTQETIASLQCAPLEEIKPAVEFIIKDRTWQKNNLQEMYEAWASRNSLALYNAAAKSPSFSYPGMKSAYFTNRNWNWAKKIDDLVEVKDKTLIVVGALHLYGKESLLEFIAHETKLVS